MNKVQMLTDKFKAMGIDAEMLSFWRRVAVPFSLLGMHTASNNGPLQNKCWTYFRFSPLFRKVRGKTVKRTESHGNTRAKSQGLPSTVQKAKYPKMWVGETDREVAKKAPKLGKCPQVTFPMKKDPERVEEVPQSK